MAEENLNEHPNQGTEPEANPEEGNSEENQNQGANLEDLSEAALKQAYKDLERKHAKASKQAGKYRTERNNLQESIEQAKKDAEKADLEEVERLKLEIAERDKLVEQAKAESQEVKRQMKRREQLTGKVADVNLAVAALNSLSSDEREEIEGNSGYDFESLFEKFPALKPQKAKPDPAKGSGGSVPKTKNESDMSDEEFYKSRTS